MKVMLHGFRRVDMINDRNEHVCGYSLFISYPSEGVQGLETKKQWVSDALAGASGWYPTVGKEVMIEFTPKGKVSSLSDVPAPANAKQ